MKTTFITTVFNEEKIIESLLESLNNQSVQPDQIVIVDGGSTDKTFSIISNFKFKTKHVKVLKKKGNRSVGRNEAIKKATGSIILVSDAGCILDKNWIKNILKKMDRKTEVVAGYYKGIAKNVFEKCLIPYALVMPDQIDSKNFLPATRSMAFRKTVWKKVHGFNQKLSHNEDYAFAKKLSSEKFKNAFAKDAIVNWFPPKTLKKAFVMFLRFAYGDAESKIYRPKALLVIARYLIGLLLIILTLVFHSWYLFIVDIFLFANYCLWATYKNYRYVEDRGAYFYLPLLQFCSDLAVIVGTIAGFFRSLTL
jgi:glycosyltransferase involved in cell wall biosynthesis